MAGAEVLCPPGAMPSPASAARVGRPPGRRVRGARWWPVLAVIAAIVLGDRGRAVADPHPLALLSAMETAYAGVRDYTARLVRTEPSKGIKNQPLLLKFREPSQLYLLWLEGPDKGREIIWASGANNGMALAHEGGFLKNLVTVVLAPDHPMILDHSLFPLTEIGIGQLIKRLGENVRRATSSNELSFLYLPPPRAGTVRVEMATPPHAEGYFCQRIVLTVDTSLQLPVAVDLFGIRGEAVASYEYRDLALNSGLTDLDFSPENPNYRFSSVRWSPAYHPTPDAADQRSPCLNSGSPGSR